MENLEFIVSEAQNGLRFDKLCVEILPELSRTRIQDLIANGFITINDLEVKANTKVKINDIISAEWPEDEELKVEAEEMDLDVLY